MGPRGPSDFLLKIRARIKLGMLPLTEREMEREGERVNKETEE